MKNDGIDIEYRGKMLERLHAAIRPRVPLDEGKRNATIQAAALMLAVVFLRAAGVPYSKEAVEDLADAAVKGMTGWLGTYETRN